MNKTCRTGTFYVMVSCTAIFSDKRKHFATDFETIPGDTFLVVIKGLFKPGFWDFDKGLSLQSSCGIDGDMTTGF